MFKKLKLALILIIIFVFSGISCLTGFAQSVPLKGDVNGDGKVNQIDINFVEYYILQSITLTPDQFTAADVNGDRQVTITDLLQIEKIILNK
jgi:hypothetical protein